MNSVVKSLVGIILKREKRVSIFIPQLSNSSRCYSQNAATCDLIVRKLDGKHAGVTVFGLNRPERKNALGVNLVNQLNEELDKINYEGNARVLIVRSLVKDTFCSGADLKERLKMPLAEVSKFVKKLRSMMNKFYNLPVPVIAAMDGAAFGGGLELALACDIRLASTNAKMGLVETKLAIIPGAGGTQRLPRLISPALAKELIFTARVFDGSKAKNLGIVNDAIEQNESGDVAYQKSLGLCEEILANGPVALRMAKAAINKGLEVDLNTGLAIEEAFYAQVIPTKDRIEALEAFQAKRRPNFIADDAGFQMGAYREKICQTPNIDSLAKKSLIFNKAFTPVSSCSPSRSAILTGLPPHQNGMYGLHQSENHFNSFDNVVSLPSALKSAGIKTGIIGKKHVGPKSVYGFDYEQTEENNSILQVGRNITKIKLLVREFLHNTSDPFFLYVAFHDPHRCGHTNPEYGQFCEKFGNGEPGMGLIPDWQGIYYQPDELILPYYIPDTSEARYDLAAQFTTMSRLDQGIGLVLKELENAGFSNNTLVIFTSDNAIPFPNGRTNLYDSGAAVPMMISSPMHQERKYQVTNSLSSLLDIAPTIYDWFNISGIAHQSTKLNGRSLLPLLQKEPSDTSKETVFGSHTLHEVTMYYPMRMVRTQRYKLIHNLNYLSSFPIDQDFYLSPTFQDMLKRSKSHQNLMWYKTLDAYYNRKEWELFDLKHDSEELNNLAFNETYGTILKELKEKLFVWQNITNDPWICGPGAVLENKGDFKNDPQCMSYLDYGAEFKEDEVEVKLI